MWHAATACAGQRCSSTSMPAAAAAQSNPAQRLLAAAKQTMAAWKSTQVQCPGAAGCGAHHEALAEANDFGVAGVPRVEIGPALKPNSGVDPQRNEWPILAAVEAAHSCTESGQPFASQQAATVAGQRGSHRWQTQQQGKRPFSKSRGLGPHLGGAQGQSCESVLEHLQGSAGRQVVGVGVSQCGICGHMHHGSLAAAAPKSSSMPAMHNDSHCMHMPRKTTRRPLPLPILLRPAGTCSKPRNLQIERFTLSRKRSPPCRLQGRQGASRGLPLMLGAVLATEAKPLVGVPLGINQLLGVLQAPQCLCTLSPCTAGLDLSGQAGTRSAATRTAACLVGSNRRGELRVWRQRGDC